MLSFCNTIIQLPHVKYKNKFIMLIFIPLNFINYLAYFLMFSY